MVAPNPPDLNQTYPFVNPLTSWCLLTVQWGCAALIALPLVVDLPWLQDNGLLAVPFVLAMAYSGVLVMRRPFAHHRWSVTSDAVASAQETRAGLLCRRAVPNRDIARVRPVGPLLLVRQRSGRRHLWPRRLVRTGTGYQFALDGDKLRLVADARGVLRRGRGPQARASQRNRPGQPSV